MNGNPPTSTCPSSSITFGRVFEGTSLFEVVRSLRERGGRLISMLANLIDVFRKVNAKSDPVVRSVRPPVSCKHCHQVGHTTRSCKVLSAEKDSQKLSDDDVAFWSFVKPDQRPKTVAEAYINQDEDSEDENSEEEEEEDMDVD